MKRQTTKQAVMSLLGLAACRVTFAGCYPLIPAYFSAGFLEGGNRAMFSTMMMLGMAVFLPITEMAKYLMILIVTALVIRLAEWANKGCFAWVGALAAGASSTLVGIFGGLMDFKTRTPALVGILEGVFVFGASMLIGRALHMFMGWRVLPVKEEPLPQGSREERLLNYARSFQGLSAVFDKMDNGRGEFSPEDMGRIQNEITGKMCASCDSCALCWDSPTSPMYGYLSQLIDSIRSVGQADCEARQKIQEYCPYTTDMVEEAVAVFERARLNMAWYNRLVENREVIAEQLDAMAYIMEDCAREDEDVSREKRKNILDLTYRAKERGILLNDVKIYQKGDGRQRLVQIGRAHV